MGWWGRATLCRSVTHDRFERWAVEELCEFAFVTVCQCVVVAAEETQVFEHGFASVGPGDDVVDITPSWLATTAFPYTVTVSGLKTDGLPQDILENRLSRWWSTWCRE